MPASLEPLDVGVQIPYHFRPDVRPFEYRIVGGYREYHLSGYPGAVDGFYPHPEPHSPAADSGLVCREPVLRSGAYTHTETTSGPGIGSDFVGSSFFRLGFVQFESCGVEEAEGTRARDSDKNRSVIAANNAREVLLSIAFADVGLESSELNHEALAVLSMFALSEPECLFVASESDRVGYLVKLLFHSSVDVRVNSAAVIETVVAGIRSSELRAQISNADGVFEGIVGILNYPLVYPRALKIGIKALFALCLVKQHRHKAVAAGAVEALIDRLPEFEKCDSERALATVELLCRIPSGCAAFESHALTVPLLVKIILKISDRATEYAAGALLSLCSASERAQADAVAAGVLTQLLLLVQSDCTERAKRKAQMLLKLLRDSWPRDSIARSDDFAGSDVVPF
ncbi:UNVERIFIED_CONTAM: U-box domain-containing protein 26 [Sesamum radiatum]|uniref:U-box domain-containing protein 26 n=1 Tax=Sesamum radiatum TaxID=300843 RepID=A0AAW2U6K5_SESRA